MTISTLLSPERIFIDIDLSSKKKLLEFIAEKASKNFTISQTKLFGNLIDRERLGSTGLGNGFGVPHARLADLDTTIGCFVRLKQGVNYEATDNQPVDLVFAIVIPEHATDEHLKILSSLAKIFSQIDVCNAIREAKTTQDVSRIIQLAEQ